MEKKEIAAVEEDVDTKQQVSSKPKGGLKTMPFIIGNEAFATVATFGIQPNLILYLMNGYHMDNAAGNNVLLKWNAASNFTPLIGAFLSDSYFGRYAVIAVASLSSFLGLILLWLTTIVPQAKPSSFCKSSSSFQICEPATFAQLALLFTSLGFISVGKGCISPCSVAFGADQFNSKDNYPRNKKIMNSYFNWYYLSSAGSVMLAMTLVVYLQDHFGWVLGFGVPAIFMFSSALLFWLGSPLYVKVRPSKSMFTGFAKVIVVAFKKRKLEFPPNNSSSWYHQGEGSKLVAPTNNLRFLNKACIIRDTEKYYGTSSRVWNFCTVDQVEALKSLVKILPIWFTIVIESVITSPNSLGLLQARTMDRHITSSFEVPAGSFGSITLITIFLWVVIYDRFIVPRLAKLTGRSNGLSPLQRMGVGLIITYINTVVAALVEGCRRRIAVKQGLSDYPEGMVNMSALWLIPHPCLGGLSQAFFSIGQIEFFYTQLPKNMSSVGMALGSLGMAGGNLVASYLIQFVDNMTKGEGKESWVSSNPNKGHYDYYYWLVSVLSLLNFLYFLVCCRAYGPCEQEEETTAIADNDEEECYSLLGGSHGNED